MEGDGTATAPELNEVMEDLCCRFILNIPEEDISSYERIFQQIQQAHWFYLDFIKENHSNLPHLDIKRFGYAIIQHVPFLSEHIHTFEDYMKIYDDWRDYRQQIPVYGAILLNAQADKCVCVKGWEAKSCWGFPKGKVNKNEKGIDCAIREVLEETGYDFSALAQAEQFIDVIMHGHRIRLYIAVGVPEDTHFLPRTRKEISKVGWFKISDLPDPSIKDPMFYMVSPFVRPLKGWIRQNLKGKRRNAPNTPSGSQNALLPTPNTTPLPYPPHLPFSMSPAVPAPPLHPFAHPLLPFPPHIHQHPPHSLTPGVGVMHPSPFPPPPHSVMPGLPGVPSFPTLPPGSPSLSAMIRSEAATPIATPQPRQSDASDLKRLLGLVDVNSGQPDVGYGGEADGNGADREDKAEGLKSLLGLSDKTPSQEGKKLQSLKFGPLGGNFGGAGAGMRRGLHTGRGAGFLNFQFNYGAISEAMRPFLYREEAAM